MVLKLDYFVLSLRTSKCGTTKVLYPIIIHLVTQNKTKIQTKIVAFLPASGKMWNVKGLIKITFSLEHISLPDQILNGNFPLISLYPLTITHIRMKLVHRILTFCIFILKMNSNPFKYFTFWDTWTTKHLI